MANLGMEMGVFVAHTIYWTEPNLTSGNQEKLDQFLKEIKESVEVAKRVNAQMDDRGSRVCQTCERIWDIRQPM